MSRAVLGAFQRLSRFDRSRHPCDTQVGLGVAGGGGGAKRLAPPG